LILEFKVDRLCFGVLRNRVIGAAQDLMGTWALFTKLASQIIDHIVTDIDYVKVYYLLSNNILLNLIQLTVGKIVLLSVRSIRKTY
jgi:hypothetical protein